jgi:hypothetical protein
MFFFQKRLVIYFFLFLTVEVAALVSSYCVTYFSDLSFPCISTCNVSGCDITLHLFKFLPLEEQVELN